MAVPVQAMSMALLVRIVNAWATPARHGRGEQDTPVPSPDEVAVDLPPGAGQPAAEDLVAIADQLYPVFALPDASERAHMVTRLLAGTGARPALLADPDLHSGWLIDDERDAGLAAAALALRAHLGDGSAP